MNLHLRVPAVYSVFGRRVEVKLDEIVSNPIEPEHGSRIGKRGLQCSPFPGQGPASLVLAAIGIFQRHISDSIVESDLGAIWVPDCIKTGDVHWALFGGLRCHWQTKQ